MATAVYQGLKYCKGRFLNVGDPLTVEEAIQININGAPYTVTMQTPGNEKDLVRGLLYSEDIYKSAISFEMEVNQTNEQGHITNVNVNIPEEELGKGYITSRNILSVSSCGICGKRELDDLTVEGEALNESDLLDVNLLAKMFEQMNSSQATFKQSGGSHAAAAFTLEGKVLAIREDIGRHNAVDKVIGALLENKQLNQARCLLVSGRVSYEIVTKAFMGNMPFLASVSAPSTLSADYAKELGITLMQKP